MFDRLDDEAVHVGDSVVVKPGVEDPDMGDNLGGWQGRVLSIEENDDGELMVDIAWDSQTLRAIAPEAIRYYEQHNLNWQLMTLSRDEVSLTSPRDTPAEVTKTIHDLVQQYVIREDDEDEDFYTDDEDEESHGTVRQEDVAIPAAVREALMAMPQQALVDIVLELAEERGEVLRALMTHIRIAPEAAARSPRNEAQVSAIKEQVARFFDELQRENEYEAEYGDWQHEYDERETYPELETTFAIARALSPDDRLEIYWFVLTCAEEINQEYALGTPQIIEAITSYADAASAIAATRADKRPYVKALVGLLDWSFGDEVSVENAIKEALERLCASDEERHDLIDVLTQENETGNADWIAGYYRQLGEDEQYLRVREAHLQHEAQYLELADYWQQHGEPERARETLEQWITAQREMAEHGEAGFNIRFGMTNGGVFDRLETLYRTQGDLENLYRILLAREQTQGINLRLYREIEETAKALGCWTEIQPQLLKHAEYSRETLAAIYLYEQEWDAAIRLANETQTTPYGYEPDVRAQVARGVQQHRPEAALHLFSAIVQELINRQKRDAYAAAAGYAIAIRDIYRTILHNEAGWQDYITTLLARYSRHRALQDEFRKVDTSAP